MKVVAAIATKGGVGKTSLVFALGVEAAKTKTVYLADLDPQGSLTRLFERRKKHGHEAGNLMLLDGVGNIRDAIAKLKRSGFERDVLFIDTPGSFMPIINSAIAVSDAVLLPMQPSLLDIEAQLDAGRAVKDMGKASRLITVLNRIDSRVGIDDAVNLITRRFGRVPLRIKQRVSYSRAHVAGQSGAEIDKACADEVAALWSVTQQTLEEGHE